MFNPEQLLAKIIENAIPGQGGGKKGKKWKKGKKRKSKGLLSSVASGSALMTAIGLGVGAYEILKSKKKNNNLTSTPPSPAGGTAPSVPPPLPLTVNKADNESVAVRPTEAVSVPSLSSKTVTGQTIGLSSGVPSEEIAIRMIQVMVAAAHADGVLDELEERNILDKMRSVDLTAEEKMFLLGELHNPKPVAKLCAGINDISLAKGMYMLAVSSIEIDTEAERNWLEELGTELGLSGEVRTFIEEHS